MADLRLSAAAEEDIVRLLAHTRDQFGAFAQRRYEALLVAGLEDIAACPERRGSSGRMELGQGVRSYHLRHSRDRARIEQGRVCRPRYLLLYRISRPDLIGVGRVLYDGMEVERHLPDLYGDE